ncbi:hypothetical protein BDQ17DRAFT_1421036 [Cyathus striatus]|nr:hypothetical protein BDQ17DRAFT_1421036 [Cyathus striatus]
MNTFKKIFGKPKKDGANFNNESHANRRARVRRSRSMPFRSSSDTDDSTFRVRPVYRGQRPLKASDVQLVLDISAEAVARDQGRYPNIPYQLRNYAEKDLIDLFPAPPTTVAHNVIECDTTTSRPTRRLSPNNFVTEDDLLPPLPQMLSLTTKGSKKSVSVSNTNGNDKEFMDER